MLLRCCGPRHVHRAPQDWLAWVYPAAGVLPARSARSAADRPNAAVLALIVAALVVAGIIVIGGKA